jgi:hypothetical protein
MGESFKTTFHRSLGAASPKSRCASNTAGNHTTKIPTRNIQKNASGAPRRSITAPTMPGAGGESYRNFAYSALACFRMEMSGRRFSRGKAASGTRSFAKPPFRYRWMGGCQPNLVGVFPFVPRFLSSVQRIRAPAVEETLHNFPAATGSSY